MAEKVYGGHDHEFVCQVADRLNCQICTKVLREPHLAVCCGQHFCESCLNEWFKKQRKESCPHCRAEGETFNHVIHKGLRSEINQLKIKCSNHGEGCEWRGELGALKTHLESDRGCGFVMVECPNKCKCHVLDYSLKIVTRNLKRKDLGQHLTLFCYLRPYQCEFCGHKDTFEAVTGWGGLFTAPLGEYGGHQATCPEVPLSCPNIKCGSQGIKRKDMDSHRGKCPHEPVKCHFAEAGCKENIPRHQLESHMTSNQQQHLLLVMKNLHQVKSKLNETEAKLIETEAKLKSNLITAVQFLSQGKETDKLSKAVDFLVASTESKRLKTDGDTIEITMPKFSEYHRRGKVWRSPPFYLREGYKMCLSVYANGVGAGAGTHVSLGICLLRGELDNRLKWPVKCSQPHSLFDTLSWNMLCMCSCHLAANEKEKELSRQEKFCDVVSCKQRLVNDCLTLNLTLAHTCNCYLVVTVV